MQPLFLAPGNGVTPHSYDLLVVAASFAIALLASFVTLDLSRRVRTSVRHTGMIWWATGALVMGTGVWSMHFLGMQAFRLPIELGFTGGMTLLSWLAAVGASAIAMGYATLSRVRPRDLFLGALFMGTGISAMHYIGMMALDMSIPIVWNIRLVTVSIAVAMLASAAALVLFHLLLRVRSTRRALYQAGASFIMALAICGMHYTGMAAANFPEGTVCLSADDLGGPDLTVMITITTGMLMISALFTSLLDARLQNTARQLNQSLQESNAKLKKANAALHQQSFADPLTGLFNRQLLEDRLIHAIRRQERAKDLRAKERQAVLFIDLDGFKAINDSFGHAAGDTILSNAAHRLRAEACNNDTVARVGGDEFLVLLDNVDSTTHCESIASRLLSLLSLPFEVAGKQLRLTCSIGIAVHPDHGERDKLIANANAAMQAAKRAGGNCYAMFEHRMGSDAAEQLELHNDLRQAIPRGELALHYQPKIDGMTGHVNGVEALLRWTHPQRGPVSPSVFIGLAERFGFISQLGNWVIHEACRQIAKWQRDGLRMHVAINLSAHQLRENGLAQHIEHALKLHGVDPSQLLCEITESVVMEDTQATQQAFEGLARIGVYLALDDFGTGYSSLNYLRRLPTQQLKIDRSFINDLEHQADARAVVEAVVRLAHALNLRVVAEGVETSGQRDILLAMHCDELQGFLYAPPMPADRLLAWIQGDRAGESADFTPSTVDSPGTPAHQHAGPRG